jgi:hypothetical protein
MEINKPSIKGDADLENSIAITCDIVIIILFIFTKNLLINTFLYFSLKDFLTT